MNWLRPVIFPTDGDGAPDGVTDDQAAVALATRQAHRLARKQVKNDIIKVSQVQTNAKPLASQRYKQQMRLRLLGGVQEGG